MDKRILFLIASLSLGIAMIILASSLASFGAEGGKGAITGEVVQGLHLEEHLEEHLGASSSSLIRDVKAAGLLQSLWNLSITYDLLEVSGKVAGISGRLLLLEVGGDGRILPILLSKRWILEGEIQDLQELMLKGFLRDGDELLVRLLRVEGASPNKPTIALHLALSITNEEGTQAQALLPFTVEED